MSPSTIDLLTLCEKVYEKSDFTAGLDGRDGASVFHLPNDTVVLAFRGTLANHDFQSAIDWLGDFHADLVEADGFPGKVHRGFLDSLNSLWPDVFDAVEGFRPKLPPLPPEPPKPWYRRLIDAIKPDNPWDDVQVAISSAIISSLPLPWNKRLVICGHSKGGALAALAAVRFAALNPTVVTFGAPEVGNKRFAKGYPESISLTRFEGPRDLVPLLPGAILGYAPTPGTCRTPGNFTRSWRKMLVGEMIAEEGAGALLHSHGLSTGYAPWCGKDDQPPPPDGAPQARAA